MCIPVGKSIDQDKSSDVIIAFKCLWLNEISLGCIYLDLGLCNRSLVISTGNDGYLVFLYEQTLVFEMRNQTALQRVAKILHYLLNSFRSLNANSQYQARHPLAEVIKTLTFVLGICKSS